MHIISYENDNEILRALTRAPFAVWRIPTPVEFELSKSGP